MPTSIEELTKTAEQERVNAKELLTLSKLEEKNGRAVNAMELDLMARLCFAQANRADVEIYILKERKDENANIT